MIKVENEVNIIEIDEIKNKAKDKVLKIISHWNDENKIIIILPDDETITVFARDITTAIQNATNINRY